MNLPPDIAAAVARASSAHGLPSALVEGVVLVESGGDPWAERMEPDYGYLWDVLANRPYRVRPEHRSMDRAPAGFPAPRGVSAHTEWIGQQTSRGLLQVMGAVAREQGFQGKFLSRLCEPETGLDHGCRLLAGLKRRYLARYGWAGVLRGYNGGSGAVVTVTNPEYPAKILDALGGVWPPGQP